MSKIRINIDGREVTGYKGQTILQVAKENGIEIPNLCYDDRLKIYGSCGLCVVEVKGVPKLLRACATEISDNMVVKTRSPRVDASRKMALELLLSNHTGDCRAPCHLACPAHVDCQGYVGLIANGQYEEAVKLLKENLPLPASIGRVCPHPCEDACRRNLVDKPVAIAALKRFVGDIVLEKGSEIKADKKPPTGKKVAIIGGGPGGLTCGYFLAKEGHQPTIYEAMPKLGGMLRYGIPKYRLSKDILDMEINLITEMGIEVITNTKIGQDISLEELRNNYDAVFVGIGAWKSSGLRCPGEELDGVLGGIDFLRMVAQDEPPQIGDTVAVVGGGNTAMDAARTAIRLGAKRVMVIYRRTIEEMPAEKIEIEEAKEEGVEFQFLLSPIKVVEKNGKIASIRCQKMRMGEPDASGRRRPMPIEGEEITVDVDTVIAAIGQRVDPSGLEDLGLTKRNTIQYDETTFQTSIPGVFAGGDAATGPKIAIEAIAQGKNAANVITSYLKGKIIPIKEPFYVTQENLTEEDFKDRERKQRIEPQVIASETRKTNFKEFTERYTEEEAKKEAGRCLECGCGDLHDCKLFAYSNMYNVDPQKLSGGKTETNFEDNHPFIDRNADKCILCGLCVRTCNEITGLTALGLVDRGFDTEVRPEFGMHLQDTDCISCGQCVSVCPVGALQEKLSIDKPVPVEANETSTVCSYCSLGCNMRLTNRGSMLLRALPDRESPVDNGLLCVKGRFGFDYSESKERIIKPIKKVNGESKEVSWEEAFSYAAEQIKSIRSKYGNNSIAIIASPRYTNEESYLISRLAKDILETENAGNSENSCNTGIKEVLGYNASTNSLDELASTDLILYVGGETYRNHPVMGMKLLDAVKRGAKLITVSPEKIKAGEWAQLEVCAKDNLDIFKSILKHTIDSGLTDQSTIENRASGFEQLKTSLENVSPCDEAVNIAELYNNAKNATIVIDEYTVAGEAAKLLANLAVITGKIGTPRNGIILLKPLCNSQGAYDMGIQKSMNDIDWKEIKGALIFGEDLTSVNLDNLELLIVGDLFMTETAKKAHVVLPTASFAESSGTYTNTERRIQKLETSLAPKTGVSNLEIIQGLAAALGTNYSANPILLWNDIKAGISEYYDIDMENFEKGQAFWTPDGNRILYTDGYNFEDGKAKLYVPGKGKAFKEFTVTDSIEKYFNNKLVEIGLNE